MPMMPTRSVGLTYMVSGAKTVMPFAARPLIETSATPKSNSLTRALLRPSSETWTSFGIAFCVGLTSK